MLAILTTIKPMIGIMNVYEIKVTKYQNPKIGLKNKRSCMFQNAAMRIIPRKARRIKLALLEETSRLYFAFFCALRVDLKLIFEISSCSAPKGHANAQRALPKNKDIINKIKKIRIKGKIAIKSVLIPIAMRIC